MTSFDGNGFDGNGTPEEDPVRLAAPADPWLAESATSAIGDATSWQDSSQATGEAPPAATAPFTSETPYGSAPPYGSAGSDWQGAPQQRRGGRRAIRWVAAVLGACVLFVAGMLALEQFRSDDNVGAPPPTTAKTAAVAPTTADPTRAPTTSPPTPTVGVTAIQQPAATADNQPDGSADTAAPESSADADAPRVVYTVSASGRRNLGSVDYIDKDGEIIRLRGIRLPWRLTFVLGARGPLVLDAQRTSGTSTGPVTCTIKVDGKVISATTARGEYASAQCSGSS